MKLFLRILFVCLSGITSVSAWAQCGTGYNQAQLNWDNLDYYYNATDPYENYVTSAQERTQKFAFGTTNLTIVASATGIVRGENGSHTGNLTGYNGEDAQFTPSSNGQTITIDFGKDVQNVRFALYDIDRSQRIDVDAFNASNAAISLNATAQSTSLVVTNSDNIDTYLTGNSSGYTNSSNSGSAIITIDGTIRKIVLTVTTVGSDPTFWLSDITACMVGTFPTNYHQSVAKRPFTGQPDYVIVTPDNNSTYMVDPVSGKAKLLFTDAEKTYLNSFAYDAKNHILYYISENATAVTTNKTLKKYDFNTEATSVVMADITATLGIPTFSNSVESGGAAFYDGALYFGIEGGRYSSSVSRENIIFRIDFAADGVTPVSASQVRATPSNSGTTSIHDWADFAVKDGVIYDFNGAFGGTNPRTYANSSIVHYDMMNQVVSNNYVNPNSADFWAGQAALDWNGNLYSFWWNSNSGGAGGIRRYNQNGTFAASVPITLAGSTWPGGAGDACESFRPKADFGDAPASYDPNPLSPALHEMDVNLRLGPGFDREWDKKISSFSDADAGDDGLPFAQILHSAGGNYAADLNFFNNTGANAKIAAWIDFNANGTFESNEGIERTVGTSGSMQSITLYWPSISTSLPHNSYTVMRIRITSAVNGMTINNPTGFFDNGEVEDYRIIVNASTLAIKHVDFTAAKEKEQVKLQWKVLEDKYVKKYTVERSNNNIDWSALGEQTAANKTDYTFVDNQPLSGTARYRLRIESLDGKTVYSNIKTIVFDRFKTEIQIVANPVKDVLTIAVYAVENGNGVITVYDANGQQVMLQQMGLQKGSNQKSISISQLSSGQYILHFQQNRFTERKQFVIVK